MRRNTVFASLFCITAFALPAVAAEGESCRKVRMAEPGWNDLTFTTGTAMVLLKALGYEAESSTLGIEVIYQALKEKDLDAYLGYWDPSMVTYYKPYKEEGSIETVRVNLTGANTRLPSRAMSGMQASRTSRISKNSPKSSTGKCTA